MIFTTVSACNAVFALWQLLLWAYTEKCICFLLNIWISET